jgi:WXG100 family type VII secretion target
MAYQGADVTQLRTAAARLDNAADTLDQLVKTLHGQVTLGGLWSGPDADRFRSQWSNQSSHAVTAAAQALRQAGGDLRRNAEEQEQASGAAGASAAHTSSGGVGSTTPTGTSQLFTTLHKSDGSKDGIYIEQVVGTDGKTRFIVYLNGTDAAERLTVLRNAEVIQGRPDDYITKKIDAALEAAGYQSGKDGPEMMLVGYSQGGMDAQNIAAAGKYHVTDLVTYGSPLTHADQSGINTVHVRATGDNVPDIPAELLALAKGPSGIPEATAIRLGLIDGIGDKVPTTEPWVGASSHIFETDPHTPIPSAFTNGGVNMDNLKNDVLGGNHGIQSTYETVGKDFDNSTDPKWVKAQDSIAKFQGEVVATVEPEPKKK